jgi:uncharacterized protein
VTKAVLDANVLVSGFGSPFGTCAKLLRLWESDRFQLVVSEAILAEVVRAWNSQYWTARFTLDEVQRAMEFLRDEAEVAAISVDVHGVASHPEDDLILATAVSANADYLVTGDKQLLAIGYYEGTTILSPREFLSILEQQEEDPDS